MNEIICPHCHTAFTIDEAGYADILKQVRDHAFEEALQERLRLACRIAHPHRCNLHAVSRHF